MARDDGAANVLLAFLLGAVSGAVVALLYAPAPGRDTRGYDDGPGVSCARFSAIASPGDAIVRRPWEVDASSIEASSARSAAGDPS